jgi:hypothetical protein
MSIIKRAMVAGSIAVPLALLTTGVANAGSPSDHGWTHWHNSYTGSMFEQSSTYAGSGGAGTMELTATADDDGGTSFEQSGTFAGTGGAGTYETSSTTEDGDNNNYSWHSGWHDGNLGYTTHNRRPHQTGYANDGAVDHVVTHEHVTPAATTDVSQGQAAPEAAPVATTVINTPTAKKKPVTYHNASKGTPNATGGSAHREVCKTVHTKKHGNGWSHDSNWSHDNNWSYADDSWSAHHESSTVAGPTGAATHSLTTAASENSSWYDESSTAAGTDGAASNHVSSAAVVDWDHHDD